MGKEKDRNYCWELLCEYTQSESLRKHALAVEACMKYYAEKYNEDVDYWGNVGLLHDFDYEKYPDYKDHPFKGAEILRTLGFEEKFVNAVLAHAEHTGKKRESLLEKTIFACDEISGFLIAVVYVKPNKKIEEVDVKSVKKKLKDKAFARAVNREEIIKGSQELNLPLDEHIQNCIEALKQAKEKLNI
jgi:putative nucleotidyltransferase with HDIG domain